MCVDSCNCRGTCSECLNDADALFGLDHLRVLVGPICEHCWTSDGEIVPAVHEETYHGWCKSMWVCESCLNRDPFDVGEDDGPLSAAQRREVEECQYRGMR